MEEKLIRLKKKVKEAENQMLQSAKELSSARKKIAPKLSKGIEGIIKEIGIENGRLEIKIEDSSPSIHGIDNIEFWFSANKGLATKPMKDVASGGEFSRLIFALKYLIADKTALPTIIFDEIDTGVSGEVAIQMVKLMKKMSLNHQVISISHLPQFAAAADHHYKVYKDHSEEKSVSKMKLLPQEERVDLIAEMIGGSNPSDTAKQSAKELLKELSDE